VVADDAGCSGRQDPITIDGASGIKTGPCWYALVSDGQRGYLVWLYRSDDQAMFDQILATVRLSPADAVDSLSPTLSAEPSAMATQ
jgi:hypothetical protein